MASCEGMCRCLRQADLSLHKGSQLQAGRGCAARCEQGSWEAHGCRCLLHACTAEDSGWGPLQGDGVLGWRHPQGTIRTPGDKSGQARRVLAVHGGRHDGACAAV